MKFSKTFQWRFHYLNSMSFTNQVEQVKLTLFCFSQIHLVDQRFPILTWLQLKKYIKIMILKFSKLYDAYTRRILSFRKCYKMSSGLTLSLQSSAIHFLPFWRGYLEAWFLINWKKEKKKRGIENIYFRTSAMTFVNCNFKVHSFRFF